VSDRRCRRPVLGGCRSSARPAAVAGGPARAPRRGAVSAVSSREPSGGSGVVSPAAGVCTRASRRTARTAFASPRAVPYPYWQLSEVDPSATQAPSALQPFDTLVCIRTIKRQRRWLRQSESTSSRTPCPRAGGRGTSARAPTPHNLRLNDELELAGQVRQCPGRRAGRPMRRGEISVVQFPPEGALRLESWVICEPARTVSKQAEHATRHANVGDDAERV
jgi:hypothetical protein